MTQMKRCLPKGNPCAYADVDALFDPILGHLNHLVARSQHLVGNPSDLVAENNGPGFGR